MFLLKEFEKKSINRISNSEYNSVANKKQKMYGLTTLGNFILCTSRYFALAAQNETFVQLVAQ